MTKDELRLAIKNDAYGYLITSDLATMTTSEKVYKTSTGDVRGIKYFATTGSDMTVGREVGTVASVNHESFLISMLDKYLYTQFPYEFGSSYEGLSTAISSSIGRAVADNISGTSGFIDYEDIDINDLSYSWPVNIDYNFSQFSLEFLYDQRVLGTDIPVKPFFEYQPSSYWKNCPDGISDPNTNYYLFTYRRVWTYDVALSIISWLMHTKILSKTTGSPVLADTIIHTIDGWELHTVAGKIITSDNENLIHAYRATKAIVTQMAAYATTAETPAADLTKIILPFSYNTVGDTYRSPLDTTGNNAWVIKAILMYDYFTGDTQFRSVAIAALDKLLLRQVATPGSPKLGLFTAGYTYVGGWGTGALTEMTQVAIEHNADMIDTLTLAYNLTSTPAYATALGLVRYYINTLWVVDPTYGDHFCTGLNVDGTKNLNVAIDNNTWVASAILSTDEDTAWDCIQYVYNNFVIKTTGGFYGCKFFNGSFDDPFVDPNPLYDDMIQPEATFGYIHLLLQFCDYTIDTTKEYFCRNLANVLYGDMMNFIYYTKWNIGVPYASRFIQDVFSTLDSLSGSATGLIVNAEMTYPAYRKLFIGIDI